MAAAFPTEIVYGYRIFSVKPVKDSKIDYRYGTFLDDTIKIAINKPAHEQADTVLHEYLHGVAATLGVFEGLPNKDAVEERTVRAFSAGISELILRNPKVMEWVVENIRSRSMSSVRRRRPSSQD